MVGSENQAHLKRSVNYVRVGLFARVKLQDRPEPFLGEGTGLLLGPGQGV